MNHFERDGIAFVYPENWTSEVEESEEGGWVVTVRSPQTAFLLVSLRPEAYDLADLADQTLDTLRSDYQELDSEPCVETIAGRMAIGHDIDLLTMDVPVVIRVRCLDTAVGPLLLLAQTAEFDREPNDQVLRAITRSLVIPED